MINDNTPAGVYRNQAFMLLGAILTDDNLTIHQKVDTLQYIAEGVIAACQYAKHRISPAGTTGEITPQCGPSPVDQTGDGSGEAA